MIDIAFHLRTILKDDPGRPDGALDLAANENFIGSDVACNRCALPYREMCTANIADHLAINLDRTIGLQDAIDVETGVD